MTLSAYIDVWTGRHTNIVHLLTGWMRCKDPTRALHYEGGGARTTATDIVCPMYMRVWDIVNIARDQTESRPVILCE